MSVISNKDYLNEKISLINDISRLVNYNVELTSFSTKIVVD